MINDDELFARELLAPLARLEPVIERHRGRRRTRMIAVSLAGVALGTVGVALAADVNPFDDIGAANRPQSSQDRLPQTVADGLLLPLAGGNKVDTARLLRQLPSGRRIYVMTTTTHELCVVIVDEARPLVAESCGPQLSAAEPTTISVLNPDPSSVPPLSYGVAVDGVASVSFLSGGVQQSVPVEDNVWAFEGNSGAARSLTVHFADGNTRLLAH